MHKTFKKAGSWYFQFLLGYLIVFVAASNIRPRNSNKHFRRFNRYNISQKWGSNSKCNISAYVIVCYNITGHLSEGNIFLNARHWTSWKSEAAKSPPVCVVGVGKGLD